MSTTVDINNKASEATTRTHPARRQTSIGLLPTDWEVKRIDEIATVVRGSSPRPAGDPKYFDGSFIPWLTVAALTNIPEWKLTVTETSSCLTEPGSRMSRKLYPGIVIITNSGATLGIAKILGIKCCANDGIAALLNQRQGDERFLCYFLNTLTNYLREVVAPGNGQPNLNTTLIGAIEVPLPPETEQQAIAAVLSDVDSLIGALDKLIAKKRDTRLAAMQQLLTGKTRLSGFSKEWETKQIAAVATPCGERNSAGRELPVLTCSKHLGFVDSLGYFKNQVFSKDLKGYKLINRGQLGYPANHVEEGSIGLQDLYDTALVSPIYVVFAPAESVDGYFLHRLLKLDSYRQKFATATNSSVDRRGSLKWPAFSEIEVPLPPREEQAAIVGVLSDMDAEIAALEVRREKTKAVKQCVMQALLTGRERLVNPEAIA